MPHSNWLGDTTSWFGSSEPTHKYVRVSWFSIDINLKMGEV